MQPVSSDLRKIVAIGLAISLLIFLSRRDDKLSSSAALSDFQVPQFCCNSLWINDYIHQLGFASTIKTWIWNWYICNVLFVNTDPKKGGRGSGALVPIPTHFFYRDVVVGYASSCLWTQNNLRGLLNGSRQWVMNSIAAKFSVIFPKCFVIHTRTWHRITSHSFTERIQLWCSLSDAFLVQLVTLASSFKSEIAQLSSAKDFAHLLHWLQHSPKLYLPCSCFLPCQ